MRFMKTFLKENWFRIAVLALLLMCYSRLGEINENVYYVADITDSGTSRIVQTLEYVDRFPL